jgi:hemerythrin-like metal-binding protein
MPEQYPIPHRLYEALPFLYLGGGILVARGLANAWGIVSGLILLTTGVLVGWKRWQYRRGRSQAHIPKPPAAKAAARAGRPEPVAPQLVWNTDYECGHAAIDSQHRRLFELGNALLDAIFEQRSKLDVELLLGELVDGITDHFCFEEGLLAGSHHPLSPGHQETHRTLLARCKEMSEQFHQGHLKAGGLIEFVLLDVVEQHIVRDDLRFLGPAE